jgi:outer membrane protein TolC
MKSIIAKGLASAAALSLAACAVQPATHAKLTETVQTVAPDAWSVAAPQNSAETDAWWKQFGDPVMHTLVALVLDGNLDVQAAAERVKQAQEITTQRRAALLPELDATATAADVRQNVPPPLGYVRQAGIGVAASWTPDVFGGERLAVLAAEAQASGRQERLNELRLALAANTAAAYIDLRWAQSNRRS